jgi:hypothetical protein
LAAAFPRLLGELPAGVEFSQKPAAYTMAFVDDPGAFQASLAKRRRAAERGKLWIAWRKRTAGRRAAGLSAPVIREGAARMGLVDGKVCSLGAEWSAIAFSARKAQAGKSRRSELGAHLLGRIHDDGARVRAGAGAFPAKKDEARGGRGLELDLAAGGDPFVVELGDGAAFVGRHRQAMFGGEGDDGQQVRWRAGEVECSRGGRNVARTFADLLG